FPFALLNTPSARFPGVPPAYNEIIPAWLLTDNPYTLQRNERKFRDRNRARRTALRVEVFRPELIDLMRDACRRLEGVRQVKEVCTARDMGGLGKNYLLEKHRTRAAEAYRFFTRRYALLALKDRLVAALAEGQRDGFDQLLATPAPGQRWEHARQILRDELGLRDVASGLRVLPRLLEQVARDVEGSKARDDERGARIIDDYAEAHTPAADDPVVRQTWEETRRLQGEVESLLARLEPDPAPGPLAYPALGRKAAANGRGPDGEARPVPLPLVS